MSLKRDSVTAWTKANGEAIANHRSQPLPNSGGGAFGSSVFGFASRTLGMTLPGPLGMVSPTGLFDRDALIKAGTTWSLSKLGNMLNSSIGGGSRAYLENLSHDNLYGSTEGYRYNHKIENRGYLSFRFPSEAYADVISPVDEVTVGDETFDTFTLPFFENPKISESRSAEYASHKIVNRNEPYRLWTGAKPMKLSVSFNITLPHLMTFARNQIDDAMSNIINSNDFKSELLYAIGDLMAAGGVESSRANSIQLSRYGINVPSIGGTQGSKDIYDISNQILTDTSHRDGLDPRSESQRARLILYCTYLINLIRSSVIGSSNATAAAEGGDSKGNAIEGAVRKYLPAPVIFLTYGSMYINSPFIATNYSITFDGKSGYEELSLLPRVIQIKLTLESYNQFENSDKIFGIPKLFSDEYATTRP